MPGNRAIINKNKGWLPLFCGFCAIPCPSIAYGDTPMTYYIDTQDHADDLLLDTLMEVLAAQAETNPDWTMQGLLALCRKTSCLEG